MQKVGNQQMFDTSHTPSHTRKCAIFFLEIANFMPGPLEVNEIGAYIHGHPLEQWCHPNCKSQFSLAI